jgi:hypothetical protein
MVSVEGVESPKPAMLASSTTLRSYSPSPSSTKGLGGITAETTTISTNHSNALNSGELEHLSNSLNVLLPVGDVVP